MQVCSDAGGVLPPDLLGYWGAGGLHWVAGPGRGHCWACTPGSAVVSRQPCQAALPVACQRARRFPLPPPPTSLQTSQASLLSHNTQTR